MRTTGVRTKMVIGVNKIQLCFFINKNYRYKQTSQEQQKNKQNKAQQQPQCSPKKKNFKHATAMTPCALQVFVLSFSLKFSWHASTAFTVNRSFQRISPKTTPYRRRKPEKNPKTPPKKKLKIILQKNTKTTQQTKPPSGRLPVKTPTRGWCPWYPPSTRPTGRLLPGRGGVCWGLGLETQRRHSGIAPRGPNKAIGAYSC